MLSAGRLASSCLKGRLCPSKSGLASVSKRFQSSTTKGTKRSFFPIFLGVSVVGSVAYSGAIRAAVIDEDFRKQFLAYAPFGHATLDFALKLEEEAVKENGDIGKVMKEQTLKLSESIIASFNELRAKFTTEASPSEPTLTEMIKEKGQAIKDVNITEAIKEKGQAIKEAIINRETVLKLEKFAAELKRIETDDAAVQNVIDSVGLFVLSVNPNSAHLNEASVAAYNQVLTSLYSLGPHLRSVKAQLETELADLQSNTDAKIETAIAKERLNGELAGRQASQQLAAQFDKEKEALVSQLQQELEAKLKQQADTLGRWWRRESRLVVDRERNGRLVKLDAALKQLKLLEDTLIDTSQDLAHAKKYKQLVCAVDALHNAIAGPVSRPFVEELRHLRNIGEGFPLAQAVVSTLDADVARRGLPTLNDLIGRFEVVRDEVRRAALVKDGAGFAGHMTSYVLSGLMFKKTGLVDGEDVEAVLARTQFHLVRGELESATRELNQLDGWPKKIALDWLHAAVSKLEYDQALKVLQTEVRLETVSQI